MMKIAVMQPYLFPYIGYFQLINTVDKFVFYDDVNFIKNGWINRNRIIINNSSKYITIQLKGASPNKIINEIEFTDNREKLKSTIRMAYCKAPYYGAVWPLIEEALSINTQKISDQSIFSVKLVCEYLGTNTKFEVSSEKYPHTKGLEKVARLVEVCRINEATTYINSYGGKELYRKDIFRESNIKLQFLRTVLTDYKQFSNVFFPSLSIIDVLMFNSVNDIQSMLENYDIL
jgi:hypothetical protein